MDPRTLPAPALERAIAYTRSAQEPVEPRDSAAVLLLREGSDGEVEVCTMLRHYAMASSAGVPVFPGGLMDPQDRAEDVPWVAGDVARWAQLLEVDEAEARAVVNAAVRETFEETGVLLAGPSADRVAASPDDGWAADRRRVESHESTFADFLRSHGWGVRADLLHLWSTWITPDFEPRRYRNRFFVAGLPDGQDVRDGSTESSALNWFSFADLIAGGREGLLQLLPPQYCLGLELYGYRDRDAVLAAAEVAPREVVRPTLEPHGSGFRLRLPQHFLELAATR